MKKLVVAIASVSAVMASGVYAENLTSTDDLELNLTGEVAVAYQKGLSNSSEGAMNITEVTLGAKPVYTTDGGVKAFGQIELGFLTDPTDVKSAYVGLGYMNAELTVGKQAYASDAFGIGKDKAFGAGNQLAATSGVDVIKVAYELDDSVNVAASVDISESEGPSAIDLYASYSVIDGLTVAGTVQSNKANSDADALLNVGVSGEYSTEMYSAGAEFTYNVDTEDMAYEVAASYNVLDNVTVAAGLGQTFFSADGADTLTQYYLNTQYKVHENAQAYVEVASNSLDNSELGYEVGMQVSF